MTAARSRPSAVQVQAATAADLASWLEIVHEVEPAFGPMPDFAATLLRKIDQGDALCVRRDGDGGPAVEGGMLLGGTGSNRWIRWLAVRATARRAGIGRALVAAAIELCGPDDVLSLDTFGADNAFGLPARTLYERLGFEGREMVGPGPEGGTRQRFVRPAGRPVAMTVLTERLRLEPITPEHGPELHRLHLDPAIAPWWDVVWSLDDAAEQAARFAAGWRRDGVSKWMAYDRVTDELIGRGGMTRAPIDGADRLEVGWAVLGEHWGQGYATEIGVS